MPGRETAHSTAELYLVVVSIRTRAVGEPGWTRQLHLSAN